MCTEDLFSCRGRQNPDVRKPDEGVVGRSKGEGEHRSVSYREGSSCNEYPTWKGLPFEYVEQTSDACRSSSMDISRALRREGGVKMREVSVNS